MKKTYFIILALIILTGCTSTGQVVKEDKVQLGAVLPLTGSSSIAGNFNREGVELGVRDVNEAGGVNGKELEVVFEDSFSKPIAAVNALRNHLIDSKDINIVISGYSSPETAAMAPIAEENKAILLACGSAAEEIRYAGDYIFRLKVAVNVEVKELMKYAYEELEARTLYILYIQNNYGESVKESSKEYFEAHGGEILGIEGFPIEQMDFRTHLTKLKNADPDIVLLAGWPQNNGQILKQAAEMGIEARYISLDALLDDQTLEIAKEAADGVIYQTEYNINREDEGFKEFKQSFEEKYDREPDLFAAMGYDAVKILAPILEICGENADCVKEELYKVENFDGASGIISFDEYGDVVKPMHMMIIKNGEFVKLA